MKYYPTLHSDRLRLRIHFVAVALGAWAVSSMQAGSLIGLGSLPDGVGTPSTAGTAISGDGSVVVGYDKAKFREGFRWTAEIVIANFKKTLTPALRGWLQSIVRAAHHAAMLVTLVCPIFAARGTPVPIPVTGWNADVVLENQPARSATYFDMGNSVWFESGLGNRTAGLPASLRVPSLLTPGLSFQLQPYHQPNVLQLTQTNATNSLVVIQPAAYSKLYLLAVSGNGGGNGTLTIHFTDNTQSGPFPFFAPDWWDGTRDPAPRRPAATGFARSLGSGPNLRYELIAPGHSLHQTDIDLAGDPNAGKPISRIEFVKAGGNVPWSTSVFALNGDPLPPPPRLGNTRLFAGFDIIGEVGLRYRIESREDLNAAEWQPLEELVLTNSPQLFLDLDSGSRSRRLYRASLVGP